MYECMYLCMWVHLLEQINGAGGWSDLVDVTHHSVSFYPPAFDHDLREASAIYQQVLSGAYPHRVTTYRVHDMGIKLGFLG